MEMKEALIAVRRKQILDAATVVFAQRGFHRTTVKDIAKQADIADGTLYNYFQNKEDLLFGILNRLNETDDRAERFQAGQSSDLRAFFRHYLRHRLGVVFENQALFQAILPELITNPRLKERYMEQVIKPTIRLADRYFEAMQASGQIRRMDTNSIIRMFTGVILGVLVMHFLGDTVTDIDTLSDTIASVMLDGLLA